MGHGAGNVFAPEGFLRFPRGNRLSRSRNLAMNRALGNIATTSQTVSCKVTLGNMSLAMQSTTVKQSVIEHMPRLRSGHGAVPEVVDLCGDDDGPEPGRRYAGLFFWFSTNSPIFSSSASSPPALGYEASTTKDPPEPDARDGSRSDDLYDGPEESSERPVGTEKHDPVSDLLDGSYDNEGFMDVARDQSDSDAEGRDLGMLDMDTISPVSPIYKRSVRKVVEGDPGGEGSSAENSGSDSYTDEEGEKKDDAVETNVDEEDDMMVPSGGTGGVVGDEDVGDTMVAADVGQDIPTDETEAPMEKESDEVTKRADDGNAPEEHPEEVVTVADILARDEAGEGSGGAATAAGHAAVEQGMGPPGPVLLPQYSMVPELLIATNMDMFNHLLVRLGYWSALASTPAQSSARAGG